MSSPVAMGPSSSRARVVVTMKLPQLQNLCKRDPLGYKDDYEGQLVRFNSELSILHLNPSVSSSRFVVLLQFICAVVSSAYKKDSPEVSASVMGLLKEKGDVLHPATRKACAQSLILLRNRGCVTPDALMTLFFDMLVVKDKELRSIAYAHIISDVKNLNKGGRNEKVNRSLQGVIHTLVNEAGAMHKARASKASKAPDSEAAERCATKATRCVSLACDLYRRRVWNDTRTVAILATACLSPVHSIQLRAVKFFLQIEDRMDEDKSKEESDEWTGVNNIDFHQHSKKTQARLKQVQKQVANRKKAIAKRQSADEEDVNKIYPAIEQLPDPQGLASNLLKSLKAGKMPFSHKLLLLNLTTRLVGTHDLLLLPLYPFIQRYLSSHQADVTKVLTYAVQACHSLVPPDDVKGVLKTVAHEFITDRNDGSQVAVGINASLRILERVPSLLTDDDDNEAGSAGLDIEAFVRDIAAFNRHRDKSVRTASKSFTNFIRASHPALLQGKHRGLTGAAVLKSGEGPKKYGEVDVAVGVEGAELLIEWEERRRKKKEAKRLAAAKKAGEKAGADEGDSDDDSDPDEAPQLLETDPKKLAAAAAADDDVLKFDNDEQEEEEEEEEEEVEEEEEEEEGDNDDDDDDDDGGWEEASDGSSVSGEWKDVVDEKEDTPSVSRKEAEKVRAEVSKTRVFSSEELARIRKLVARENAIKRDPRLAAKRKRELARGEGDDFSDLDGSDSDSLDDFSDDDDDEEGGGVKGRVSEESIMAESKRRRLNKMERLQSIKDGREKFESKSRNGGSTNTEKKRKKNFLMQRQSWEMRRSKNDKQTRTNGAGRKAKSFTAKTVGKHNNGKRRRK
mmetsp:Transcript_19617/g.40691  ORF Transcript_19617/g.40691 Transcript_19617/m.40691 type:complete len:849 (+) Transcript_19617:51-2597(+)